MSDDARVRWYYHNNVAGNLTLLEVMREHSIGQVRLLQHLRHRRRAAAFSIITMLWCADVIASYD
ncbi:MAG: hypothetical protein C1943_03375 [Halochromatium sp.]|nr:hypothetical protein [Halochromatium sp.]